MHLSISVSKPGTPPEKQIKGSKHFVFVVVHPAIWESPTGIDTFVFFFFFFFSLFFFFSIFQGDSGSTRVDSFHLPKLSHSGRSLADIYKSHNAPGGGRG